MASVLLKDKPAELEIRFHSAAGRPSMTLDSIPEKAGAKVVAVDAAGSGGLRLMEMGIVPGARVQVVNRAPLGDPLQILVRNYHLALRRKEAQSVHVTLCGE